ncbi:MAG: tetratricopeptide repeat protein [Bacteroidales bacterium OttesenSCG-928-I14]|jgi:tetratricopeptide (TPR) repeat protein|nr:tetratricopeptide repeat protein [Bacteroidales bacterium OttesenSCG-928-I14]
MKRKASNFIIYTLTLLIFHCGYLFSEELSYDDRFKSDYFFLESIHHKQKNEHTQSFNALQYILKFDSLSSAVLYELSKYYIFLKKKKLALVSLQKAVSYDHKNFDYRIALANLIQNFKNDNDKTIDMYEKLLKEDTQNTELYYYLSKLYIKQQNINKAIETLNKIENNIGISEFISLQKSQLYKLIGKENQALNEIKLLARRNQTESKYQIFIGDFYLNKNDIEKALLCYKKSQTINHNNPYYYIAIFNFYNKKGNNNAAIKEIKKAFNDFTLDVETKLNILEIFINNSYINNKDKKITYLLFEILLKQYPQNKKLNLFYAKFLLQQSSWKEAKLQLKIVSTYAKKNLEIWMQLLNIALNKNNIDEVIFICNNALNYFPNIPEFYLYEGLALMTKKSYKNALCIYLKGLKMISTDNTQLLSIFCEQIGNIYYKFGHKIKSFIFYEKAIHYNNKNIIALNNYAYYLSLTKKNLNKAEKMANTVINTEYDNAIYLDTYLGILFKQKKYLLAKFYIENVFFKKNIMNKNILKYYSNIFYILGERDKAIYVLGKSFF